MSYGRVIVEEKYRQKYYIKETMLRTVFEQQIVHGVFTINPFDMYWLVLYSVRIQTLTNDLLYHHLILKYVGYLPHWQSDHILFLYCCQFKSNFANMCLACGKS